MHSANTERPESDSPSCGRYPTVTPFMSVCEPPSSESMPARIFEQRRFAGAVGADEAGALVGRDQPVEIFKQDFGAKALGCACELNH